MPEHLIPEFPSPLKKQLSKASLIFLFMVVVFNTTDRFIGDRMAMVKKSITLTDQQNDWLQSQIQKGLYASDSEILRELIREKQEASLNELRILAIRSALEEGEASGVSERSPEDIKKAVLARRSTNA
jgi:antitoxin ParD1/3/4